MISKWPEPYLTPEQQKSEPDEKPSWTPAQCDAAATDLVRAFMAPRGDQVYKAYLEIVKRFYAAYNARHTPPDLTQQYENLIRGVHTGGPQGSFNSHDFANIHRIAWLRLLFAFSSLVDKNPHGDWGDPKPPAKVSKGRENDHFHIECFHVTPNQYGYYAITATDVASGPPTL